MPEMKNIALGIAALLTLLPTAVRADEFLGLTFPDETEIAGQTEGRLELESQLSHDELVTHYQGLVEDLPDIKILERDDSTQITDYGRLEWHSITVYREPAEGAPAVLILEDSWSWILGTLVFRYIGVFGVIIVLFLSMSISGFVISRSLSKLDGQEGGGDGSAGSGGDPNEAIAIAAAVVKQHEDRRSGER
jgi:hypothetical protein